MKRRVYRIYTESTPDFDSNTEAILAEHFGSATLSAGTGYWQGQKEATTIIEIVGTPDDAGRVAYIAKRIRDANKQEAVLVTATDAEVHLI